MLAWKVIYCILAILDYALQFCFLKPFSGQFKTQSLVQFIAFIAKFVIIYITNYLHCLCHTKKI